MNYKAIDKTKLARLTKQLCAGESNSRPTGFPSKALAPQLPSHIPSCTIGSFIYKRKLKQTLSQDDGMGRAAFCCEFR